MLYKRDYNILTIEEELALQKAEDFYSKNKDNDGVISSSALMKYHHMHPNSAYFYKSLFPNNYLDSKELSQTPKLNQLQNEFKNLLDSDISERNILNFINQGYYYPIIGSLFQEGYDFGHHDRYLFKEFELTSSYFADYLLIGKNSHGFHFIFIELENPYQHITLNNGELGTAFRKGIKQVEDWDNWFEANFHSLRLIFEKYKNKRLPLPDEFTQLDKSRIHYIVIAGRRKDFNENTYRIRRKFLKTNNIKLLHYDNLIDSFASLIRHKNY